MWDLIVSVPDHCLSFYFIQQADDTQWFNEQTGTEVRVHYNTLHHLDD